MRIEMRIEMRLEMRLEMRSEMRSFDFWRTRPMRSLFSRLVPLARAHWHTPLVWQFLKAQGN